VAAAVILLAVAVPAAWWTRSRPPLRTADVASEVTCEGNLAAGARCHRLLVPENRRDPRGRTIPLRIAILPATGSDRLPDPIFYLAGGPGQAATELMRDRELADPSLRERRDLVFADQRGTGASNALRCHFYGPPDDPQSYFQAFLPIDKVRACRAELESKADLTQYTTSASVEDLEAIRVALGYPQINLLGGSYGTRLAMEYLRRYGPEGRVRTVILESPVAPDSHSPENFGQMAAAALDAMFDECASTPSCATAFPDIREEARIVFDRLRQTNATATIFHPASRKSAEVTLTRDHVAEAIRYMLYSARGASMVPLYLHEAFTGNFAPIADFLIRWRAEGTFDGLYLSITCAEDVAFVPAEAADRDEPTFLGGYRVRQQRAACAEWPHGTRPEIAGQPVTSTVPVLMTSGALDPVTPSANADVLMRTLPNAVHVRVPFSGHSAAGLNGLGCLSTLKRTFIEQARTDALDTSCVAGIERPGFGVRDPR